MMPAAHRGGELIGVHRPLAQQLEDGKRKRRYVHRDRVGHIPFGILPRSYTNTNTPARTPSEFTALKPGIPSLGSQGVMNAVAALDPRAMSSDARQSTAAAPLIRQATRR